MRADILRKKFLDFFKARKHKVVESDSLLPKDDPTVLFTPAGMNQFKKQFLGHISGFRRAATAQRCLRTDDLERVGKTPCHHTFFEMLGNFSFGDYFKEEAISFAWEFLTGELKIKKEKLWVSVYKDDTEGYNIWKDKIRVPPDTIIKLGDKENFWPAEAKEKGPNGPCGPCSEIFFDRGSDIGCKRPDCSPSCNCWRFTEVWNLVFTQFNRGEGGILAPLPSKNIDTGMGLERLAAVMQGKANNFETELFWPLIKEVVVSGSLDHKKNFILVNAVADHIRAIAFSIFDGALPSNEGRGYVIRKLIRKSTLHLKEMGFKKPFLYKLVPVLSEIMKAPYPDLDARKENISEIILREENKFIETLSFSEPIFEEKFKGFGPNSDIKKAGLIAFQLYDTHGIPFELTKKWANQHGIGILFDAFNEASREQKARSKLSSAMKGDVFNIKDLHLKVAKTNFSGYAKYEAKAKILKIIKDNALVKKITKGEEAKIILDKTAFYPESGGQAGDVGEFKRGKNIFQVTDTQKFDKVILHKGIVKEGSFKASDELKACVDLERRLSIERNHTATHLLQAALRKVLGTHVQQQGSLVTEDKLRFDFTHFSGLASEQLDRIEQIVNEYVLSNQPLSVKEIPLSAAKKSGALAFFGDKYEGRVRVISIGDFSKELCGGTHLDSTGQIGLFKITQEGSVASGVRRIEAVTALAAYKIMKEEEAIIADLSSAWKVPKDKVKQEQERRDVWIKDLEQQLNSAKLALLEISIPELLNKAEIVNNISVITALENDIDMGTLRKVMDLVKQKISNAVIALSSQDILNSRALLVLGITPDLVSKGLDASTIIRDVAAVIGGSGGGRKDFAQAGGNNPGNIEKAFQELRNIIGNLK